MHRVVRLERALWSMPRPAAAHRPFSASTLSHQVDGAPGDRTNTDNPAAVADVLPPHAAAVSEAANPHKGNPEDSLPDPRFPKPDSRPMKRRVPGSPTLRLEAVTLPAAVQTAVSAAVSATGLKPRPLRDLAIPSFTNRARETYRIRDRAPTGPPVVPPTPLYSADESAAYAATRMPGTYAAAAHILAELRRARPTFAPASLLDFGAGPGTATLAAAAAFGSPAFARHAMLPPLKQPDSAGPQATSPATALSTNTPINLVCLVDSSTAMRTLATNLLQASPDLPDGMELNLAPNLPSNGKERYDLVVAAYALGDIVRSCINVPDIPCDKPNQDGEIPSQFRERAAESRLRKQVRSLWNAVAPGGMLVVIEDGTAGGFETVMFSRDAVLSGAAEPGGINQAEKGKTHAHVVAPCLHSKKCPLDGSATRHRVCRFVQRLNRPPFQRAAHPRHDAFEDDYFSYIVLQRPSEGEGGEEPPEEERWGRIVRSPLRRGKHVTVDGCTSAGTLERRVVSKGKSPEGYYHLARKSKWGDIWPVVPEGKVQPVNF